MNMPGFTAEASVYETRGTYRAGEFFYDSAASMIEPQRLSLGYTCEGRYCDCAGVPDCIDMINGKCGGWTRCVIINGTLRCLCEPRFSMIQ